MLVFSTNGAVITVPAYFDDAQRQATKDAAKIAGLEVFDCSMSQLQRQSPTVCKKGTTEKRSLCMIWVVVLLMFRFLKLSDGVFQVLSTAGDTHLGGDDFDRALLDVWLRQTGHNYDALEDVQLAWKRAEEAKRTLSDADSAVVDVGSEWQSVSSTIERSVWETRDSISSR